MVSWNRWASWVTTPIVVAHRRQRGVADVDAVDADRARLHVVEPGHEVADRRLPRARVTDERDELARLDA